MINSLFREMIDSKGQRLIVSINDLRRRKAERARGLLNNSFDEVAAFQRLAGTTAEINY